MTKDKTAKNLLPDNSLLVVSRGVAELRAGRPVMLDTNLIFPSEFASEAAVKAIQKMTGMTVEIVISKARASMLGLASSAVAVVVDKPSDIIKTEWLYNPLVKAGAKKPKVQKFANSAVFELMRIAELLPSAIIVQPKKKLPDLVRLKKSDVAKYIQHGGESLEEVIRANVPLTYGDAEVVLFRPSSGGHEHMAVVFGKVAGKTPLVRIHSSCITGDILASLKCDCGEQLAKAAGKIAASGCGVLVYVNQEGRGIGFANKLRAYNLQDRGADTIDANELLGFAADERDFDVVAAILKKLKVRKVRLLTNNPKKVDGLKKLGIAVNGRNPLITTVTEKNKNYLKTKASRAGHLL